MFLSPARARDNHESIFLHLLLRELIDIGEERNTPSPFSGGFLRPPNELRRTEDEVFPRGMFAMTAFVHPSFIRVTSV